MSRASWASEVKPPATKEKADETPDDEFAHALDDAEMSLAETSN